MNNLITYKPYSNPNKGNPNATWVQKNKKKLILKQTKAERVFYDAFKRKFKMKIVPQKVIRINGRRFFLDFYIPSKKLAIELDGKYHLGIKEKDYIRDFILLQEKKITTKRFTNEQVLENPFKCILEATGD